MVKKIWIFLAVLGLLSFAGCKDAKSPEQEENIDKVEETVVETENDNEEGENISDSESEEEENSEAVENKRIAVYVQGYDRHNDTITVDEIEWLTVEDAERLDELGIDPDTISDGYYINNPYDRIDEYKITEKTTFSCVDYDTAEVYGVTKDDWYNNVTGGAIYWLRISGTEIESIEEQYLP